MHTTPMYGDHDSDLSFKVYHELMARKVRDILLISSPYDAFIMEEEGRLAQRIIEEYRGLNLSRPPRLTWVSTARQAIDALTRKPFDFVITMPRFDEVDALIFSQEVKTKFPDLPVFLLTHNTASILIHQKLSHSGTFDRTLVWSGNADLLLALIKSVEDRWNISYDTGRARVRVIILVEDSPYYRSSLLPLLYKEIVSQTQAVIEDALNDEHRLLKMRARPKILVTENFEEAMDLYRQYKPYLLSVFSDVRFPRDGRPAADAGFDLLSQIKADNPDLPLLMLSSEIANQEKAANIPAVFVDKNSPTLHTEIRHFFKENLGFGDFVFRLPHGHEVARADSLRTMEKVLPSVPDVSVAYHAKRNDFSTWLMARTEIILASVLRPKKVTDFRSVASLKEYLADCIYQRRRGRQLGIVTEFDAEGFDPDADYIKIGKGSLGGKARGLAFISSLLNRERGYMDRFDGVDIFVPKTFVISTEGFDAFVSENGLTAFADTEMSDSDITDAFLAARFPRWLERTLETFLAHADYPLAIRSSSLLEDAHFEPFAGIYKTYMLPNNDPDPGVRLAQLIQAVRLVYASTYLATPRAYARSTLHRIEEEKMAVVIQQLIGQTHDNIFYPALSGVAQSFNYYPIAHLKSENGIAHLALGLGKTVVEGGTALRFSPKYPQFLPQMSTVDDILNNAQKYFYALKMEGDRPDLAKGDDATLVRLEVDDAREHPPVKSLASTYSHEDHRIRDGAIPGGYPVLTFAAILKHKMFPLPEILGEILDMGRKGMGSPVEVEFAVNFAPGRERSVEFAVVQIRPMAWGPLQADVEITGAEVEQAWFYSQSALGVSKSWRFSDIVYVKPDTFNPAHTVSMVREISFFNAALVKAGRKYLLIGPGRWGSADHWLGIPVTWQNISGVAAIVETATDKLKADPSQGSHFFHNITSLGISYITLAPNGDDFIDWQWLNSLPAKEESTYIRHVHLEAGLTMKINGKKSTAVIMRT